MAAEKDRILLVQDHRSSNCPVDTAEELRALKSGEVDADAGRARTGEVDRELEPIDAFHRFMMQEMTDGTVIVDQDGVILSSNEQCARALGQPISSLVGACIHDFVAPVDAPAIAALLRAVPAGGVSVQLKRLGAIPVQVPARVTAHPVLLNKSRSICLLIKDLSGQESQNQELAAVMRQKTDMLHAMELQTQELRHVLAEKQLLLQEVHHRVKNNLQVICSLLSLQAGRASEAAARELEETQRRIMSMALIHESIFGCRQRTEVDFGQYAQSLVADTLRTYDAMDIICNLCVDPVMLNIEQAIPCALIVNELIMARIKDAGFENSKGSLTLRISKSGEDDIAIALSDDRLLTSDGADLSGLKSLSLTIVTILAKQLRGQVAVTRSPGTMFEVTFPRDATTTRRVDV